MSPRTRLPKILFALALTLGLAALAFTLFPAEESPAGRRSGQEGPQTPSDTMTDDPQAGAAAVEQTVIAAAGDIACSPKNMFFNRGEGTKSWCRHKDTAALIPKIDPDYVAALGDTQYDSALKREYRRSYRPTWGSFRPITYAVVGNHEYYAGKPTGFFQFFSTTVGDPSAKGWFSDDLPGWHLVVLNSNCELKVDCTSGSAQHSWLKRDLQASNATCEVALFHHPRFASGPHGNDRSVAPLFKLLYSQGVDLVLTAHDHLYERFAPIAPNGSKDRSRGIRQFVVGTGGAQHYRVEKRARSSQVVNTKTFGVLKVTLSDDDTFAWKFVPIKGQHFTDAGSGACH